MTRPSPTADDYARSMIAVGEALDLKVLDDDEIAEARDLSARLMGREVAPEAAFATVRRLQPGSVMGCRQDGRLTGVTAMLLMPARAMGAMLTGDFDGMAPDDTQLSRPGEAAALYYIWGVAGATNLARWRAMEFCRRLRFDVLADLTGFTRAATAAGRRAGSDRLGFRPVRGPEDNLLISPPITERLAA